MERFNNRLSTMYTIYCQSYHVQCTLYTVHCFVITRIHILLYYNSVYATCCSQSLFLFNNTNTTLSTHRPIHSYFPHTTPTFRTPRLLSAHHSYFPHTTTTSCTSRTVCNARAIDNRYAYSTRHKYVNAQYTVHCTLYAVHCTLYPVHCTLYAVHCTLYTVRRTLYGNSQYIGDVIYNIILIITTTIQEQSMQTGNVNISRR